MKPDCPKQFSIVLRNEPGNHLAPVEARLRAALKGMLRGYGLRVVSCNPIALDGSETVTVKVAPAAIVKRCPCGSRHHDAGHCFRGTRSAKIASMISAGLTVAAVLLAAPVRTSLTLTWDYPTNELSGMFFNLYTATSLTPPVVWTLATNVAASNLVATNLNVSVPVQPGAAFFFCTASNEFGESIPSNTATAILARAVGTLKAR